MANSKISELSELTTVANDDVLAIVDDSTSTTKKISFANLSAGISVGNATQLQFTALNSTGSTLTKGLGGLCLWAYHRDAGGRRRQYFRGFDAGVWHCLR